MRDNNGKTNAFRRFEKNKESQLRYMEDLYDKFQRSQLSQHTHPEAYL